MEKQRAWNLVRFQSAWLSKTSVLRGLSTRSSGFKVVAGDASQNWLVLKNGPHAIGLFQGMFEKNILTLNPGWDSNANKLDRFKDVRDLQRELKAQGVQLTSEADETSTGPASFTTVDPDGNPILVDQHV